MSLRERSIVNWIIYHLGMDRVYHTMQSMTGALKGQPQTSMISHLVNVFFGYTQLEGRWRVANRPLWLRARLIQQTLVKYQVQKSNEEFWSQMRCEQGDTYSTLRLSVALKWLVDPQEINPSHLSSKYAKLSLVSASKMQQFASFLQFITAGSG